MHAPETIPRRIVSPAFRSWFRRTLILAPHCDDEVFCGGLIAKLTAGNCVVRIAVAIAADDHISHARRIVRAEERLEELRASTRILGVDEKHIHVGFIGSRVRLEKIPQRIIVSWLDDLLKRHRPTAVLLPYSSHHQDHQLVHDSARAALRHNPTGTVRFAALWEYPYILSDPWGHEIHHMGRITFDITGPPMEAKLRALQAHRSQTLGKPNGHLITPEGVEKLASLRGLEIGREFGESYYLIRGMII